MENGGGYLVNHVVLKLPGHWSPWTCFHGWRGVTTVGEEGLRVKKRGMEDADTEIRELNKG